MSAQETTLDITGEVCPMTYVRTKLALEALGPGDVLSVRLAGDEPLRNVPRSAEADGHVILSMVRADDGTHRVRIRKGG